MSLSRGAEMPLNVFAACLPARSSARRSSAMTLPLAVEQEIVRCLRPLNPAKVILFGSYAKGTATEDSDIDLAVIVRGVKLTTHREKMARYLPAAYALDSVHKKYALDLFVYSTDEWESMKQSRHSFWKEIKATGRELYAV
jgi:predicted nucleotidyltransferase